MRRKLNISTHLFIRHSPCRAGLAGQQDSPSSTLCHPYRQNSQLHMSHQALASGRTCVASLQCTPRSAKHVRNWFSTHPEIGYAWMTVQISLAQTKVASVLSVDTVKYCLFWLCMQQGQQAVLGSGMSATHSQDRPVLIIRGSSVFMPASVMRRNVTLNVAAQCQSRALEYTSAFTSLLFVIMTLVISNLLLEKYSHQPLTMQGWSCGSDGHAQLSSSPPIQAEQSVTNVPSGFGFQPHAVVQFPVHPQVCKMHRERVQHTLHRICIGDSSNLAGTDQSKQCALSGYSHVLSLSGFACNRGSRQYWGSGMSVTHSQDRPVLIIRGSSVSMPAPVIRRNVLLHSVRAAHWSTHMQSQASYS
jgi:hypothetical protein